MCAGQEGKPLVLKSVKKAEQKVVNDPNANKVIPKVASSDKQPPE